MMMAADGAAYFLDICVLNLFDEFVKSPQGRHSREGGSPEMLEKTGFPPSRE